jgi:uncharacterized protein YbjT (DUF2867 family)
MANTESTPAAPILLTGGTGNLGGHVLPLLREAGRDVRVLTRSARASDDDGVSYVVGDLSQDGDPGTAKALEGVETVVHLAGAPKGDEVTTGHLLKAAAAAGGVRHFLYMSVIGAGEVPFGYFRSKIAAEQAVLDSGLPYTILRAAQFHDFATNMFKTLAKSPVIPLPGVMRAQTVDVRDCAERVAALALGEPAGRAPDLAGPAVHPLGDLLRDYLKATGKRRLVLPAPLPGKAGRAYRDGVNLTLEGADLGTRTWEDFLAELTH